MISGEFPFAPVYCLAWICLDVLFCTASIMHLCTISVDRYLSLRYPMKFGRNKTRRRVILKITFVWLLSIAMSLPLSLMHSKNLSSVLVNGSCQIPDPLYKLIGSIISFYIPLGVMILTYTLTVRHLAAKRQNLQTGITRNTNHSGNNGRSWRRILRRNYRRTRSDESDVQLAKTGEPVTAINSVTVDEKEANRETALDKPQFSNTRTDKTTSPNIGQSIYDNENIKINNHVQQPNTPISSCTSTPFKHHLSACSTDTEMTSLDARELWLPDSELTPSTMSALHQFGAEMLRLSRGLEQVASSPESKPTSPTRSRLSSTKSDGDNENCENDLEHYLNESVDSEETDTPHNRRIKRQRRRRRKRSGTLHDSMRRRFDSQQHNRPVRMRSFHEDEFRDRTDQPDPEQINGGDENEPKIVGTLLKAEYQRKPGLDEEICLLPPPPNHQDSMSGAVVSSTPPPKQLSTVDTVTRWTPSSNLIKTSVAGLNQPLRRAMTQKLIRKKTPILGSSKQQTHMTRYGSTLGLPATANSSRPNTPQRSENISRSSVMIRNSYRHGRIIRLEQKATKVLGVVFFTFVVLWTPFFALNLVPSICPTCEAYISKGVMDLVTWLGYASSMVNPVFYTIFNKVFRQAFKRVLLCKYRKRNKRQSWPPPPTRKL
ncbi:uncharacterized protein LOC126909155 [Daktulosphaira vitifoliae]|uniref:uncharacterized protein LOC126909155 n=1 Tax=Daktulosphaira vitifoliae TaxID=58002 RepID=UPI0021AA6FBC|nr:uncharacterized protein LOC126909155 [Daktulosphaira vitifoliae]